MKETTAQIHEYINKKESLDYLEELRDSNPKHEHNELTIEEAVEKYQLVCSILNEEIATGRFDLYPQSRRVNFLNHLINIFFPAHNLNAVLQYIDNLHDELLISGMLTNNIGKATFVSERNELTKTKRKYQSIIKTLNSSKSKLDFINDGKTNFENLISEIETNSDNIRNLSDEAQNYKDKLDLQYNSFDVKLGEVKEVQEEIEEKRLSITTFHNNIEEYKVTIEKLENQLKQLLQREIEIKVLIDSAHDALNLGSAVGVSAAFAKQYEESNKPWKKNSWVFGAGLFLLLAAGLTIWIVSDVKNSDKIAVVIGRIVAVGITLAGAVFCSRQYLKQKHIAEDYAYKAVLSKSIVAFTEEIADSHEKGEEQVGNYLNKVLTEIHKDPLRERGVSRSRRGFSDRQLEQITEVVKTVAETIKPG